MNTTMTYLEALEASQSNYYDFKANHPNVDVKSFYDLQAEAERYLEELFEQDRIAIHG